MMERNQNSSTVAGGETETVDILTKGAILSSSYKENSSATGETDFQVCQLDNENDYDDDLKNADSVNFELDHNSNITFDDSNGRSQSLLMSSTDAEHSDNHSEGRDLCKKPLHIIDTWEEITKRDRLLSSESLVHVMDHSMAMLGERICEATNDNYFRESLKAFEHTLGRFKNSEIHLGQRIAGGNFADIYRIRSFRQQEEKDRTEGTQRACTPDQAKVADIVKRNKPEEYVVKVLRKSLLINTSLFATGAADFITEGTLLASFDHPHILSIRGRSIYGVEGFSSGKRDSVFLILERMNGDLTNKINQWKKKTSKHGVFAKGRRNFNASLMLERIVLMSNLAAALAYLHERRVIHRDVGLSNVGISFSKGEVKLLDFGLAKVLPRSTNGNEKFLLTGTTGSIRYMAPEIGLKQPYNLKADVYSFAILLYEVLSLEKLFNNWKSNEIVERVHHQRFRPRISLFWSQRMKELIRCCWSDNPDDRLPMNYVEAVLKKESRELQMMNST